MHVRGKMTVPTLAPTGSFHYEYEVLKGHFQQSENETDDSNFDFVSLLGIKEENVRVVLTVVDQRKVRLDTEKL
jgi:hypothetical protein